MESGDAGAAKLWPALWGAYGWPYVSLGLLKLFGDALNFAGMAISFCSNPKNSTEMFVFASKRFLAQPNIIPNNM